MVEPSWKSAEGELSERYQSGKLPGRYHIEKLFSRHRKILHALFNIWSPRGIEPCAIKFNLEIQTVQFSRANLVGIRY